MEKFATRMAIEKYRKILATYLTLEERSSVERRLKDETTVFYEITRHG